MKFKPYTELLKATQDAKEALMVPVRAKKAKHQAKLAVSKLEGRIADLETEVATLTNLTKEDIDFDDLLDKLDEIALAERRKKQFERLIEDMFPETA